jgi:uncharacterized membrane protein
MSTGTRRIVRRTFLAIAIIGSAVALLAAAIDGSPVRIAVAALFTLGAYVAAAFETRPGRSERDGRQIPLDDDHKHDA